MALVFDKDLRPILKRADWSIGNRSGVPVSATIHYNGPAVGGAGNPLREIDQLLFDAQYHIDKNWSNKEGQYQPGDGIMYHIAILSDGQVCQLRNLDAILWHCGSEVGNRTSLAIHFPIGGTQRATERQWESAKALFTSLMHTYKWSSRNSIKMHKEWKATDCPGADLTNRLKLWRTATDDPWLGWGTAFPITVEQRKWGVPTAWFNNRWLGEARSYETYLDPNTSFTTFQNGYILYEKLINSTTIEKRGRNIP